MPIQTAFNAGEWSPLMGGQISLDKRDSALALCLNMIALKQGPLVRRGGTKYTAEIKSSAARSALIDFEFSTIQAYIIECGDQYFRFFRDNAQITSAGSPYEIASPYLQADLFNSDNLFQIQYAQSADVLYLNHGSYAPRALVRSTHTSWALNTLILNDGPYLDTNTTATTFTLSGTTGSVTVTASAVTGINDGTGFQTTDIGRLIRWKDPAGNWTWLKITARTSTTVVTALISGPNASAGTATVNWRLGVWSDTTGWPRTIAFFQNRVAFGGCTAFPDRYDLTKTGGYSDTELLFAPTNAAGTVADDNAISGTIQSGSVNNIQWMAADSRGLIIGTVKEEWVVRPSELNVALTPTNAKADLFSRTGSAYIQPVKADTGTTFIQRARRRAFDIIYSFEQDSLKPRDLTLAAEHITQSGIIGICYQQEPANLIWALRNDGLLVPLTYYPDQSVFGWQRHKIGGVSDALGTNAIVESAKVIPSADGSRDEIWLIVKRFINGGTKRYVEYMTRYYEDDLDQDQAFQVDCGLTYDGVATATVTGADHLEGQVVKLMVDGKSHPDKTVVGGSVTLSFGVTGELIHLGLSNPWAFQTLPLESTTPSKDTAQGKIKRITNVVVRLLNTLGLKYGPDVVHLEEYDFGQGITYDTVTPLFTGDTPELAWPGGYETQGAQYYTHDGVFPACIIALMPNVKTYEQ